MAEDGISQTIQRRWEAALADLSRHVHEDKPFPAKPASCLARQDYESFLDTMTANLERPVGRLEDLRKMIPTHMAELASGLTREF